MSIRRTIASLCFVLPASLPALGAPVAAIPPKTRSKAS